MIGGAVGVYSSPRGGPEACAKFSNLTFAIILLIVAFSPTKLLAFYENDVTKFKFAIGDWILMIWCILASFFVQVSERRYSSGKKAVQKIDFYRK